jgi:hypothetical protein
VTGVTFFGDFYGYSWELGYSHDQIPHDWKLMLASRILFTPTGLLGLFSLNVHYAEGMRTVTTSGRV